MPARFARAHHVDIKMIKHIRAFFQTRAQRLTALESVKEFLQQLFLHALSSRFDLHFERAVQRQTGLQQNRHLRRKSQDVFSIEALLALGGALARGYLAQ